MIKLLRILFFAFCGGALVFALHRMFDVKKVVERKEEAERQIEEKTEQFENEVLDKLE